MKTEESSFGTQEVVSTRVCVQVLVLQLHCTYIHVHVHYLLFIIVSLRLMYEVHCSQFFGTLESDEFRVESPVDNLGQCRNVSIMIL